MAVDRNDIADRLIAAQDAVRELPPFTASEPDFNVDDAYAVLDIIERKRRQQGWRPVGRKIGFTNRTIWPRYNVYQPNWAHIWSHTMQFAKDGQGTIDLSRFVNPRIEPEIAFKLKEPVPLSDDPVTLLSAVEWMAPAFEIVQSHFPDWKFRLPDCTASWALHGALLVGAPLPIDETNRALVAAALPRNSVTLSHDGRIVDRGTASNVLDSPALALGHLVRVLRSLPQFPPLAAGEIVSTGTITDAWPVKGGETWSSDYGELGLEGLTLRFAGAR
jgi:2-oxo-3-hexenedioate decarboxylase